MNQDDFAAQTQQPIQDGLPMFIWPLNCPSNIWNCETVEHPEDRLHFHDSQIGQLFRGGAMFANRGVSNFRLLDETWVITPCSFVQQDVQPNDLGEPTGLACFTVIRPELFAKILSSASELWGTGVRDPTVSEAAQAPMLLNRVQARVIGEAYKSREASDALCTGSCPFSTSQKAVGTVLHKQEKCDVVSLGNQTSSSPLKNFVFFHQVPEEYVDTVISELRSMGHIGASSSQIDIEQALQAARSLRQAQVGNH